jgi:gas vesicle protein
MNKNIDELIKSALEGHEMPYDNNAWNSFEKKLNKPNAPIKPFKFWFFGTSIIAVITISSLLYFSSKQEENNDKPVEQKMDLIEKSNSQSTTSKKTKSEKTKGIQDDKISSNELEVKEDVKKETKTNLILPKVNEILAEEITKDLKLDEEIPNPKKGNSVNTKKVTEPDVPSFSNKCLGENLKVINKNDEGMTLIFPSGKKVSVAESATENIKLSEEGKYELLVNSKQKESYNSFFSVFENPRATLLVEDELNYETGLPIIRGEVQTFEESIKWKVDKVVSANSSKAKTAAFYFFKKGQFELEVIVSNEKGCSSIERKTISISEDYNLLAVNAFDPLSSDSRKNTFMPYALSKRNSAFSLIIIDPDNGGIIFESSDASNPWDGIDKRNGKLVSESKTFIWKVTLSSPEKNEKAVYKGTITRI